MNSMMNDMSNSVIKVLNSGNIFFYMEIIPYCFLAYIVGRAFFSKPLKSTANFSQTLIDFLKILNESIQLLSKNGKLLGLVTIISLLLSSILFWLFTYSFQYLINSIVELDSSLLIFLQIIILVPLNTMAFFLSCSLVFQISAIATILVSAATYTGGNKLSLENLLCRMKATWRRQLCNSFSRWRDPTRLQLAVGAASHVAICLMTIVFSPSFSFMMPVSSDWPLSSVVSVVEESFDGGEAAEEARRLVEGHGVYGFMQTLVYCVLQVCCVMLLVFGGPMIDATRGRGGRLLLLNAVSLGRILWSLLHTVSYFRCKKEKGEPIVQTYFDASH